LDKTKIIDPQIITDISVYSLAVPILVFLFFPFNWKDKLKWFCFLFLLTTPLIEFFAVEASKSPIASGTIISTKHNNSSHIVDLHSEKGTIHKGQLFVSDTFRGIINSVRINATEHNRLSVEIKENSENLQNGQKYRIHSNLHFENVALLVESIFFFVFFYFAFITDRRWKSITVSIMLLAILMWLINNVFIGTIFVYDTYYSGASTIAIIFLALAFFFLQMNKQDNLFIYDSPVFWIISAVLIFKAGTFFLFLYLGTLKQEEQDSFYIIHSIFNIIKNLLFAVAFLKRQKSLNVHYSKLHKSR
jgi:hypothetical protein